MMQVQVIVTANLYPILSLILYLIRYPILMLTVVMTADGPLQNPQNGTNQRQNRHLGSNPQSQPNGQHLNLQKRKKHQNRQNIQHLNRRNGQRPNHGRLRSQQNGNNQRPNRQSIQLPNHRRIGHGTIQRQNRHLGSNPQNQPNGQHPSLQKRKKHQNQQS